MKNNGIESDGFHPTIGELLLYVDNEMEPDLARAVQSHLATCRDCMLARDRLARGIAVLTAFTHSAELPPAPSSIAVLEDRLLGGAPASAPRRSLLSRLFAPLSRRPFALAGAFACLVVVAAVIFQASQQVAKASQLLTQSIAASDSVRNAGKTIRQTVRFRQGRRVFEKSVFRGKLANNRDVQAPGAGLEGILARASVDWNDPLNPRDFARWREAQPGRSDVISETTGTVTITTSTTDSTIAGGSLTLARSDWRPVARRIDLRAEPAVEIAEVAYELIDGGGTPQTVRPAGHGVTEATAPAGTVLASPLPSALNLEASELRLREALAFLGLDLNAAPTIWRTADSIHFRIHPESPEDATRLRAAVKDIPLVVEGGEDPAPTSDVVATPAAREFESTAPFARILESRLGGLEPMNDYLTSVQDHYGRALAHSSAVSGLAIRYPAGYQMPDSLEERLNRLVGEHMTAQNSELVSYLQSLELGLEAIRPGAPAGSHAPAKSRACLAWQEPSRRIALELRELNVTFLRLFISEKTVNPTEQEPEILLAECERLKASLEEHLAALCAPPGR